MDDKHSWNTIDVAVISTDTRLQMREKLSPDTVAEYKQLYIDAKEQATEPDEPIWPFSEPVAICIVEGKYLVTDGNHRVEAARQAGWQWIRATLIDGTMQDALIAACGANAAHGLRRSNADKRAAVVAALSDPVLCTYSDRRIADICKVSNRLVGNVRQELSTVNGSQSNQTRIGADGRECRLPQKQFDAITQGWLDLPSDELRYMVDEHREFRHMAVWSLHTHGIPDAGISQRLGIDADHVGRILRPLEHEVCGPACIIDDENDESAWSDVWRRCLAESAAAIIKQLLAYPDMPQQALQAALSRLDAGLDGMLSILDFDGASDGAFYMAACNAAHQWQDAGWIDGESVARDMAECLRVLESPEHQEWCEAHLPLLASAC